MAKNIIHPKEHDDILGVVTQWLEENGSDPGVNFVESIQGQMTSQRFLTMKQFTILQEIIPGLNDLVPETF